MTYKTKNEKKSFARNRWGGLKQAHLPCSLQVDGTLDLPNDALTVYPALLHLHQNKMVGMQPDKRIDEPFARIKVSQNTLMRYTGFSKNTITSATKRLKEFGLVEIEYPRKKKGDFERISTKWMYRQWAAGTSAIGNWVEPMHRQRRSAKNPHNMTSKANVYWLLNPSGLFNRTALETKGQVNVIPTSGIKYFSFPSCIITHSDEKWSLAKMTGSEVRLYFAICWLSNKHWKREGNELEATTADLRKASGLKSSKTFIKALEGLQHRSLVALWPSGSDKNLRLELCDPLTGSPIPPYDDPRNQPANYRLKGRRKRPTLNVFNPEEVKKAICDANDERDEPVTHRDNGELMMRCPFHSDDTPSLSANFKKNGCWYCHGCHRKGGVFDLLAQLTGKMIGEAIQSLAATKGIEVEYQDPDEGATIYQYKTEDGKKVLKEVVTRIKEGKKLITQRRPGSDGYICDAEGVPPSLYHVELLRWASTVCIVEGEKDADTVTNLELSRWSRAVVGVTSGGAASWKAEFAKHLIGKKVVLMPDDDEAGDRYAGAVEESLKAENIEYRRISFKGTGCKDVSEYMVEHTAGDLVRLFGLDWVEIPTGNWVSDIAPGPYTTSSYAMDERITI